MEKLTKNQIKILDLFRGNIFTSKTIRDISLHLKISYPKAHDAINELNRKKIINIKKVGNSSVCEVNLSPQAMSILSFLDEQEAFSRNIPNIEKILEFKELLDDIIIITGSYAKSKQNKKSDIDLVIITKDDVFKKQKLLENKLSLFVPEIHLVVISYNDFIKMLLDDEPNYGKEIFKNRLLFKGLTRYYELIKEAIKNGYRG